MKLFNISKQDFFVIRQLAHKDKSRENASTILGQFWQILDPFINTIVLVLIFGVMFKNKKFVNYPMYVATGVMVFNLFGFGTKNCLTALSGNKNFLIKAQMEKTLYLKERVYVALLNFIYSLIIYVILMFFFKIPFHWTFILLVPDIFLLAMFVYGFGKILSVINALFADISYFHDIFTLFVFYGSALFYNPANVAPNVQFLLSLNPIYLAVAIARVSVLDGVIPHYAMWVKLGCYAIFMFLIGSKVFEKGTENIVAKL